MDSWHHCFKVLWLPKKKMLLNSHLMTWLWHIKMFASLEILLLGYCDILMHANISISIYNQSVSEPDIPTSTTLGLMYHFKCSILFHRCTFRDDYPESLSAIFRTSFKIRIFFVCYLSMAIFTLVLSSLGFEMCLMSLA